MNTSGVLMTVLGVWVLVQVLRGNLLQRLGIIPGSGAGSAIEGAGNYLDGGGAIEGGGYPISQASNPTGALT